ncbi:hypothetical protein LGM42_22260 [Burkholderia sp. AU39826]|nr:hypothetical protein [Burkholderia sp. AU39826]MCA7972603.1 hypothetical protein [Burkholderia sp. AU39826]
MASFVAAVLDVSVAAAAPVAPVAPVVLAASVAPPVNDLAAAGFAVMALSASGDRAVVEKSICIVSVRVSVDEVTWRKSPSSSFTAFVTRNLNIEGRVDYCTMTEIDGERARFAAWRRW